MTGDKIGHVYEMLNGNWSYECSRCDEVGKYATRNSAENALRTHAHVDHPVRIPIYRDPQ